MGNPSYRNDPAAAPMNAAPSVVQPASAATTTNEPSQLDRPPRNETPKTSAFWPKDLADLLPSVKSAEPANSSGGPTPVQTDSASRGGSVTNTTVYADKFGDNKQDNISVLDIRVEKTVNLMDRAKLRLFLDGFNLTNKYAAETIITTAGATFQQPTAILAPRTARIGFRFMW